MIHVLIFWSIYITGWAVCGWVVERRLNRRGLGEPWADGVTAYTVAVVWPLVALALFLAPE